MKRDDITTAAIDKDDIVRTVEEHAREACTRPRILAAAKAFHQWGAGKQLSSAEFARAIAQVENIRLH